MPITLQPLSKSKIKSIKKLNQKKFRYQTESTICEGFRLFTAARSIAPKNIIEVILNESFLTSDRFPKVEKFCKKNNIDLIGCENKIFQTISNEKSPQGLLFLISTSFQKQSAVDQLTEKNCLYLENISDPGNLGTIIRTAAWYGISEILLSPDSVDPFNPKVIRASAGGIFSVNIYLDIEVETIINFGTKNNYDLIGTSLEGSLHLPDWKVSDKNIIFFGGEARGLTTHAKKSLSKQIFIFGLRQVESLNLSVSAGIILNHLFNNINNNQ